MCIYEDIERKQLKQYFRNPKVVTMLYVSYGANVTVQNC